MPRFVAASSLVLFFGVTGASAQTVVTSCRSAVSNAVLGADLDCSAEGGPAISIHDNGTLDLAGYTITESEEASVVCAKDCTVVGSGGSILGSGGIGIDGRDMLIQDLTIEGFHRGIRGRNVTLQDSTVQGNTAIGLRTYRGNVTIENCEFSSNGLAVHAEKSLEVSDSQIHDNLEGVLALKVDLLNTSITDNVRVGVHAPRLRAVGSTITGNNAGDVGCDYCADIATMRRPKLTSSACDTSLDIDGMGEHTDNDGSFGICTLD